MIGRSAYLNKLTSFRDRELIKVITGVRRCGKSTLLQLFRDRLVADGIDEGRITFVNFEDMDNERLTDPNELHRYILSRLVPGAMNYVFLDEIQNVRDFPRVLDSLFIRKNVDLYVTGSNAHMLSGEIVTLLAGRYVEISMLPFSFGEYLTFLGDRTDLSRKFADYVRFGSFPYAIALGSDPEKNRDYLGGIYNTVILKDVIARRGISDFLMLESVVRFMADNIGSLLSTKKISDTMGSNGRKISTHTVESYVSALRDAFVFYRAKRYDVRGRQLLKTNDKYYIVDPGLRYYLLGARAGDIGKLLENVVYLELLRRGYDVYVGRAGECEIDFVALKGGERQYYQVAASVRDQDTMHRELRPLDALSDHYPKYLLTLDDDPPVDHNGIRQINAIDFLLEESS